MLTKNGTLVLGIVAIVTTLYLSLDFMIKSLTEKKPRESFKYLILSTCNMLSLLFVANVI